MIACNTCQAVHAGSEDTQEKLLSELRATTDAPMDVTVIDQGSFAFMEFDDMQDAPPDGPVISGIQAVQILPSNLACRALHFPAIDATQQVGLSECNFTCQEQLEAQVAAGFWHGCSWGGCIAGPPDTT